MERPRTGHRYHQTGSITVVDLIRRNPGPIRIPSADEITTDDFVEDLLGPSDDGDGHRGRMAKAAKLVGLAVGSVVLCGSVIAASTLSHQRKPAPPLQLATIAPITGVGVLRPDTLRAQLGSHGTPGRPDTGTAPPRSGPVTTPSRPWGDPGDPARRDTPTTATVVTTSAKPVVATPESATDVVRDFYRLVVSQPTAAADLLSPALRSADPLGFVESWDSMRQGQVRLEDVTTAPGDGVQVVVRMLQPDGTWLRAVELLHVSPGLTPVIDSAELLSAQHS